MIKIRLSILLISLLLISCHTDIKSSPESANQETVKEFVNNVWNNKDHTKLERYFSSSFKRRVNNVEIATNNVELAAHIGVYQAGFPDMHLHIDELLSFQNKVLVKWSISGTNTQMFGELAPTGKKIKVNGISVIEFNPQGKIIYEDVYYNELSLIQQLGYEMSPPNFE